MPALIKIEEEHPSNNEDDIPSGKDGKASRSKKKTQNRKKKGAAMEDDEQLTNKKKKQLEKKKHRKWNDGYKQLQRFYNNNGHCNVPEDGVYYTLHQWCGEQISGTHAETTYR